MFDGFLSQKCLENNVNYHFDHILGRDSSCKGFQNGTHISVLHQSLYDWVILDWNFFGLQHHIKTNVGAIAEKEQILYALIHIIFSMLDIHKFDTVHHLQFFLNFITDGIDSEDHKLLVNFSKENDIGKCLNNNIV